MKPSSIATHPRPTRRQLLQAGALAGAGLLAPLPAQAATTRLSSQAQSLVLGINGHPLNAHSYNANGSTIPGVPRSTQVDMITQMGMQLYRVDIGTNAAGLAHNHALLVNLFGDLDAAGVGLFPMFYDNYSAVISEQENYDRGFVKGAGLATNYGHMFTHCNLGNEWELFKDLYNGSGVGHMEGHYHLDRTSRAMHWIRGADDGMKSVKPDALTSVATAGWFPTWWQNHLLTNVDLDFVDWHWYAEMPGQIHNLPDPLNEITSIFDFLWDEFGLPIWVSESNSRSRETNSQEENEHRQAEWFNEFYAECFNHPHCEALLVHELLDNPLIGKAYEELNYGLVKFPNIDPEMDPEDADYTDWEWKQLGRQLAGLDHVIGHFGSDSEGWVLGLGPEYPGAQGTFVRDNSDAKGGNWSGLLTGNFSAGGNYVQISRPIDLDLSDLRLWVRSADLAQVTLRMTDSTGQYHQQRITITPGDTWQPLHISTFNGGQDYSHWDGADDGAWHAPASQIALVLARTSLVAGQTSGEVRVDSVTATVPD